MIHKLRTRAEGESGFTLIELLIVIIILGILATIVLFATGTFTSDSAAAACKANVRIMQTAEAAYSASHAGATSNHGSDLTTYLTDPIPSTGKGAVTWNGSAWACA